MYFYCQINQIMTTYYNQQELKSSMKRLIKECLTECRECEELPENFVDLIKHNFLAKFVCYNKKTQEIEIGVEDFSEESLYPQIKIYKFPITANKKWVEKSLKDGRNDLDFYGRLLNKKKLANRDAEVVVM